MAPSSGKMGDGCIYLFSAFWAVALLINYMDAVSGNWFMGGHQVGWVEMKGRDSIEFTHFIMMAINAFALHQTWAVAYPDGEELVCNKPNHKNPMISKAFGWVVAGISLMMAMMFHFFPDAMGGNMFYEAAYFRW